MVCRTLATLIALVSALALTGCNGSGFALSFKNDSGVPLHLAPVVTDPPPPHREVSSDTVAPGLRHQIATDDFNPMFYDPVSKLSIAVQFDWQSQFPVVLGRVMQHVVPPGEEGTDPALQPTLVMDYPFEVDLQSTKKNVEVKAGPVAQQLPVTVQQF